MPRSHYTFLNAIFLYKTTNEAEWITLPCSDDHSKYNCCGIRFDGLGVCVTQRNTEHESVCHLKLVLKSPAITTENDQLTFEAACVAVRSLDLVPDCDGKDTTHALEYSRTLPLALIGDTIIAVTLYDLNGTCDGTETLEQQELIQLIPSLIKQGFRKWSARHRNGSSESITQPETRSAPVSNSGQIVTSRAIIPNTRQPRKLRKPNAQPDSPSSPSADSPGAEQLARKPTLEQRLKTHQIEVTTTELRLRQRLEDDRHAMVRAVTRPVTEAINREFDRVVEEALKEHRARAEFIFWKIVADDG